MIPEGALEIRRPVRGPARLGAPDPAELLPQLMFLFSRAQEPLPQYLTLKQAKAYMGLSEAFLRRLMDAGQLHAVRDGRLKLRKADLDALPAPEELMRILAPPADPEKATPTVEAV